MRKTIQLLSDRHKPPQALALVKNTLRKYLKRERRKELPEGVDFWDFDCRIGLVEDDLEEVHVAELIQRLDALATAGATSVFVEILAKPGVRRKRAPASEE